MPDGAEPIITRHWLSPAGEFVLGSRGGRLCACYWAAERQAPAVRARIMQCLGAGFAEGTSEAIEMAITQLVEYFDGDRRAFDMPLALAGTAFQRRVWTELTKIPYGRTISYGMLAERIGNPKAVRAVAAANAANPLSIFVPCHRVIASNGSLTGYAGGLDAKRLLLAIEARQST